MKIRIDQVPEGRSIKYAGIIFHISRVDNGWYNIISSDRMSNWVQADTEVEIVDSVEDMLAQDKEVNKAIEDSGVYGYKVNEKKPGDVVATAVFTLADGSKQYHDIKIPDNDIVGEHRIETSAGIDSPVTVESVAKGAAEAWANEIIEQVRDRQKEQSDVVEQIMWGTTTGPKDGFIGKIDYQQIAQETANYHQVVPDSQWYSTLEQIQSAIRLIRMRYQTKQLEAKDYGAGIWSTTLEQEIHDLLIGIDNTIAKGYYIQEGTK